MAHAQNNHFDELHNVARHKKNRPPGHTPSPQRERAFPSASFARRGCEGVLSFGLGMREQYVGGGVCAVHGQWLFFFCKMSVLLCGAARTHQLYTLRDGHREREHT